MICIHVSPRTVRQTKLGGSYFQRSYFTVILYASNSTIKHHSSACTLRCFHASNISRLLLLVFTHMYKRIHNKLVANVQSHSKMCFFHTRIQWKKLTENSWFILSTQRSSRKDQLVSFPKELPNYLKNFHFFKYTIESICNWFYVKISLMN